MESELPPEEIETPRRRGRRRGRYPNGRAWVVGLWILLRIGDLPMLWLSFQSNQYLFYRMRGQTIIAILWTTALLTAVWAKQKWARYVTLFFLGLGAVAIVFATSVIGLEAARGDLVLINTNYLALILTSSVCHLAAFIILLRSKSIKHLVDPAQRWKPSQL